ncbi:MAG: ankyrin repeat domain-containing protein [Candidatus Micrarchaeota archaeon]|nr:ankyrin repeat domain-containing protein [Candidatus Micrarchaeota archaeon]
MHRDFLEKTTGKQSSGIRNSVMKHNKPLIDQFNSNFQMNYISNRPNSEELNEAIKFFNRLISRILEKESMYSIYLTLSRYKRDKKLLELFKKIENSEQDYILIQFKKHQLLNLLFDKFYELYPNNDEQISNNGIIKYMIKVFETLYVSPWYFDNRFLAECNNNKRLYFETKYSNGVVSFVHEAILNRNPFALLFLIKIGFNYSGSSVDLLRRNEYYKLRPIELASLIGDPYCLETLLNNGVNVHKFPNSHVPLIHYAIMSDNVSVVKTLLDHGLELLIYNNKNESSLDIAKKTSQKMEKYVLRKLRKSYFKNL